MRPIEIWLNDAQLGAIYSSGYWNDVDEEKKKEWWIVDGNDQKCLEYLRRSGLLFAFEKASPAVALSEERPLKVLDLAAGIGWTSALLSRLQNVGEVHAVEISKHRLGLLFERCVELLQGDETKLFRYLGSFYDLRFNDGSMDIIFMSQTFHHAEKPLLLLAECDRVLRQGGRIILTGEHYMGGWQIIRKFMSTLLRERKLIVNFHDLFPPDEKLGDHYYRVSDYYLLFRLMGYTIRDQRLCDGKVIYIADKPPQKNT